MHHLGFDSIIIAPESQREKYEKFNAQGFYVNNVNFISDFTLPKIIQLIKQISLDKEINSITTLSEDDMDWVGMLHDHFVFGNSHFASNSLFKDKYYMRSFLVDVVNQPKFRLIENPNDIDIFWNESNGKKAIIKPRFGAGSYGVKKVYKHDTNFDGIENLYSGNYLIEEYIDVNDMFTCDGYSIGSEVVRFFSHEYEELLLDSFSSNHDFVIRTNSYYWKDCEMIWKAFIESRKVLEIFSVKNEITPFHFEWFVDTSSGEMIFCEVGKRFGGADIPFIIEYAFNVDVLKEYWNILESRKNELTVIRTITDLEQPNLIAATYCPYKREGKIISIPDKSLFDWTNNTWIFVKDGTETRNSSSIVENIFISEFTSKTEYEYYKNLKRLRELRDMFEYEVEK